jgi:hypothetical protein
MDELEILGWDDDAGWTHQDPSGVIFRGTIYIDINTMAGALVKILRLLYSENSSLFSTLTTRFRTNFSLTKNDFRGSKPVCNTIYVNTNSDNEAKRKFLLRFFAAFQINKDEIKIIKGGERNIRILIEQKYPGSTALNAKGEKVYADKASYGCYFCIECHNIVHLVNRLTGIRIFVIGDTIRNVLCRVQS